MMERLVPLVVLTVISLAFPVVAAGGSDGGEADLLSVRQSLIPMFGKSIFFPTNYFHEKHFPLRRLNPAVKPYLRTYLDDYRISSQFDPSYRRGAIWLLGLIGDEQDITRVDRLIQQRLKSGNAEKPTSLLTLAGFIGLFAGSHERRGTEGIQVFIERYGTPDAWAMKSEIGSPRSRELAVERCGNFLVPAYLYSRSGNLKSLVTRKDSKTGLPLLDQRRRPLVQEQSPPGYDTLMLECTVEQSKLEMYYRECFKTWGKDIERLIASVDTLGTRHHVRDLESLRGIVKEAMAEYDKVRAAVLAKDFESLSARLLEDGRALDPKKRDRLLEEYRSGLRRERDVFRLMHMDYVKPANFKVERAVTNTFSSLDANDQPRGLKTEETISVTYDLEGTTAVGTSQFRRLRGTLTVAGDGTLIVMMKKLNGKWYWNPFGWGVRTPGEAPTVLLGIAPGPDSARRESAPMTDDKVAVRAANRTQAAPNGPSAGVVQTVLVLSAGVLLGAALAWFLLTRKSTRTASQRKS